MEESRSQARWTRDAAPRRWTESEWDEVLKRLRDEGAIEARFVKFSADDVERLLAALPRVEGKVHLSRVDFRTSAFGKRVPFGAHFIFEDGVYFRGATFGDYARFRTATFESRAEFHEAAFGDGADFGGADFRERADFRGATFGSGADFRSATFGDVADFSRTTLGERADFRVRTFEKEAVFSDVTFGEGARFIDATFEDEADFSRATFKEGADFSRATFKEGADFGWARLEGVSLEGAWLAGADLTGASFDNRSILTGVSLFTSEDGARRPPHLADVRWGGALVSGIADWPSRSPRLAEDPDPNWPRNSSAVAGSLLADLWRKIRRRPPLPEPSPLDTGPQADATADLGRAVRAYRQVATLLSDQGMAETARGFAYRASQLERRARRGLPRFISFLLDLVSGYGSSLGRVFATYLIAVSAFAVIYGLFSVGKTTWRNAFWFSLIAFHGRGVINGNVGPRDALLWVPALEAMVGLFVEAIFIATLIRRLFRD
jgi:uncharacterized protein YjbI with pentapeptide repeats